MLVRLRLLSAADLSVATNGVRWHALLIGLGGTSRFLLIGYRFPIQHFRCAAPDLHPADNLQYMDCKALLCYALSSMVAPMFVIHLVNKKNMLHFQITFDRAKHRQCQESGRVILDRVVATEVPWSDASIREILCIHIVIPFRKLCTSSMQSARDLLYGMKAQYR
ncbi:hypothetical protein CYMTET_18639 [Cymbomonas tetramitiformis]|uniref:Uncharacterized protein n=1 Tax=Cymbomonas tetramitiformis TaxID=36881 RepID=A0AAE0G818_9CHLO|nr:hypothetical protein CYMTET_18639 [Cymbomonas tetramitiformis]